MSLKIKPKAPMPLSSEDIVLEYFRLIENRDIKNVLDLFDNDAVVYEPFSKEEGLRGRLSIEPFLKVAMMANSNLKRRVEIKPVNPNKVTALVTFEKGDKVKGTFAFEFTSHNSATGEKKIKSLHIEF
jgi:hypothetical protein